MSLVPDAPVLFAWYLSHPTESEFEGLLETMTASPCLVPQNWWFEIRNMLIEAERSHRIEPSETAGILADLSGLPLEIDRSVQSEVCLALARKHQISVSEAAYLELAARSGSDLVSRSQTLIQAAREEGIETRFS